MFDLFLQFLILLTLTSYILFCCFLLNNSSAQFTSVYFFRLNSLTLEGRQKISFFQVSCMFTSRFDDFFFRYEKLFPSSLQKLQFFSENFSDFQNKGYKLEDRLLICVVAYSPWVSFYLTPLPTAFEIVCREYLKKVFEVSFSWKLPLSI